MTPACKLGPVITHEEVKKEKTQQNMGANNLIKTHLEKKCSFIIIFLIDFIIIFIITITAGIIAGVSRDVSGKCAWFWGVTLIS